MIAPKTPPPWGRARNDEFINDEFGVVLGRIYRSEDASYAVHAASALPAVVEALRELRRIEGLLSLGFLPDESCMEAGLAADAALLKAEGGE